MVDDERDNELGTGLRQLEVPPHRPDFFAELFTRLDQEARQEVPRSTGSHGRQPLWKRPAALVAAVIAAAVIASGVLLPPGESPGPLGPQLASAAEVRSRVDEALGRLETLQGRVTVTCTVPVGACAPPEEGGRASLTWSFVTTSTGDELVTGVGHLDTISYRADSGRQRSVSKSFGLLSAEVITGLPPGPPDFAARPSVLRRNVAAVVRTFLTTTEDVPVEEVIVDGRRAWRLVTKVAPNKLAGPGGSGDSLEVTVDRRTGFPLRIKESLRGKLLQDVRLSRLVVDEPVPPRTFRVDIPARAQVFRQDAGFRRIKLDEVDDAVGYGPVLPAKVPDGFRLDQVTFAEEALSTGSEGANPPSREVVSAVYRRGFDRLVVTTRLRGDYPRATRTGAGGPGWADPLASGEGFVDDPSRFRVPAGALKGASAELVVSPRGVPHAWALTDDLVVTVAGDATSDELRSAIESFRRAP